MSSLRKALEFARKNGYDTVEQLPDWKGCETYEPLFGKKEEPHFVGLPLFIIVEPSGNTRFSTPDEALDRI